MGFSPFGLLGRVEVPLALPLIAAGFRTAAVQVVATATLAALVGGGGLGAIINDGFGNQDRAKIYAGGLLVAAVALLTELSLAGVQRVVTPGAAKQGAKRAQPVETADAPDTAVVA
jgi:osmoprotectant transport system permease protein